MSVSEAFWSIPTEKLLPTLPTTARGRTNVGLVTAPARGKVGAQAYSDGQEGGNGPGAVSQAEGVGIRDLHDPWRQPHFALHACECAEAELSADRKLRLKTFYRV